MFGKEGARLFGVAVHLVGQRRQIIEFLFVAQLGDELHVDVAPVQVALEIEQVGFQQRLHALHRRPRAEAGDRRPRLVEHTVHPGCVDARQRRGLRETQVGGGEAQRAAELAPAHHPAADRIRTAEQVVGTGEVAVLQQLADAGAGNALAMQVDRFDLASSEAQFGAHLLQQGQVTTAAVAEAELRADPDFACAQAVGQQLVDERLGRHRCHGRVEAQQADRIDAELAQDLDLAARQGQPRRWCALGEELTRQRLERHGHRGHAQGARAGDRVADQRTMPQVEAVECTDTDHASAGEQLPALDASEQPAHQLSFRPARGRRFNGVTLKYSRHKR